MILIAVGANLPGPAGEAPIETCRWAVERVARLGGLRLDQVSRWYRSEAVPRSDQPDYVNGVIRLSGAVDPASLLAQLHAIEDQGGRVRGARNAARTVDLDIIDMVGMVRDSPDPILPHPRARDRAFVLLPLAEVAPDWIEPRSRSPVSALIAALPGNPHANSAHGCGDALAPLRWPTPYS